MKAESGKDDFLEDKLKLLEIREKQLRELGLAHDRTMVWLQVLQHLSWSAGGRHDPDSMIEDWAECLVSELGFQCAIVFELLGSENRVIVRSCQGTLPVQPTGSGFSERFLRAIPNLDGKPSDELRALLGLKHLHCMQIAPRDRSPLLFVVGHSDLPSVQIYYGSEDTAYFRMSVKGVEGSISHMGLLRELDAEQGKLRAMNGALESLVRERTQDLTQANQELSKNLEELRLAQQRLLESNRLSALGQMAGGIAHEINTPLAIVKNLSEQMQELIDEDPVDKPQITKMSTGIQKTIDRIAGIVQGLRTFSRDGSRDPYQEVNVLGLVQSTLSFCQERFKYLGTRIIVEEIDRAMVFHGCETQVSQVLLNLMNNSQDAIESLPDKWLKVGARDLGSEIEISVTDSGNGIPESVRQKLFSPFFTTKDIGKGTGLGLSISKGIIDTHGGALEIDAQSPNTRFNIRLPKRTQSKNAA